MKTPSLEEKVEMYESLLHRLQMHAVVTMDSEKVRILMGNICNWSYAHRQGNGGLSGDERQAQINHAFWRLDKVEHD